MATHLHTDSTVVRVMKQLDAYLLELGLRSGERLPSERSMSELFDVSRSTVREAIQRLAARGMLETRRGSGVFVVGTQAVEPASAWLQLIDGYPELRDETLEFRSIFECCVARLAAQRATDDEHARLGLIVQEMARAVQDEDIDAEARSDARFHLTLAAISHNFMLTQFYGTVISRLREHITHNTYDANRNVKHARERSIARFEQHKLIYEAVITRSSDGAALAMSRHLDFVSAQFAGK
jgi:GntR family transcriptional repressor for pyruvate dehydrogenase complex